MKKLPVEMNPFVGSRCPISLPLTIIETLPCGKEWAAANVSLFTNKKDIIYFGNGKEEYGIWKFRDIWEDESVDPFSISEEKIVDTIKQQLNLDRYVVMDLDSSLIGRAGNYPLHEQLIYGYDDVQQCFLVLYLDVPNISLDHKPHKEMKFPYKLFRESFKIMKEYYCSPDNFRELFIRKRRFFSPITLITPGVISNRFYLAQTALEKIRIEFEGECSICKYPNGTADGREQIDCYTGIGVLLRLLSILDWEEERLYRYLSEHKVSLSFMALYENSRLMLHTFKLIKDVFCVENAFYEKLVCEYEKTCDLLKQIYYLRIKYLALKNDFIIKRMKLKLESVYQMQYTSLKQIYEIGLACGIAKMGER